MLFAIGAGSQVVAADSTSNYPAEAPTTELSAYQPNAEAIANYQPDLVVLSDDIDTIVDQLRTLAIPTVLMPAAKTVDDTYAQIADLGALAGHPGPAQDLNRRVRADIAKLVADLPARSQPLTYYYELDTNYYSVTSQTFVGTLLGSLGLVNIADAKGSATNAYPQLSAEVIIDASPDLIFLADTKCCGQSAATVAGRAGWSGITAVRNGGVVELDDDIASRWGPRVVDLLRIVADAVAKAPQP
jgi:iron complex transport system substrate-binding protein